MSEQTPSSMHDVMDSAFKSQAFLNEKLADEHMVLDRNVKTQMRKEVNRLKEKMGAVMQFKEDLPEEIIDGMEEVIVNTEAKLDGKPMRFKSDDVDVQDESAINQLAA